LLAARDPVVLDVWARLLQPINPREWAIVGTVRSLAEAVAQFHVLQPHVLITEVGLLGDATGVSVQTIKSVRPDLEIIAIIPEGQDSEPHQLPGLTCLIREKSLALELVPLLRSLLGYLPAQAMALFNAGYPRLRVKGAPIDPPTLPLT
jgi:hypothetical protein